MRNKELVFAISLAGIVGISPHSYAASEYSYADFENLDSFSHHVEKDVEETDACNFSRESLKLARKHIQNFYVLVDSYQFQEARRTLSLLNQHIDRTMDLADATCSYLSQEAVLERIALEGQIRYAPENAKRIPISAIHSDAAEQYFSRISRENAELRNAVDRVNAFKDQIEAFKRMGIENNQADLAMEYRREFLDMNNLLSTSLQQLSDKTKFSEIQHEEQQLKEILQKTRSQKTTLLNNLSMSLEGVNHQHLRNVGMRTIVVPATTEGVTTDNNGSALEFDSGNVIIFTVSGSWKANAFTIIPSSDSSKPALCSDADLYTNQYAGPMGYVKQLNRGESFSKSIGTSVSGGISFVVSISASVSTSWSWTTSNGVSYQEAYFCDAPNALDYGILPDIPLGALYATFESRSGDVTPVLITPGTAYEFRAAGTLTLNVNDASGTARQLNEGNMTVLVNQYTRLHPFVSAFNDFLVRPADKNGENSGLLAFMENVAYSGRPSVSIQNFISQWMLTHPTMLDPDTHLPNEGLLQMFVRIAENILEIKVLDKKTQELVYQQQGLEIQRSGASKRLELYQHFLAKMGSLGDLYRRATEESQKIKVLIGANILRKQLQLDIARNNLRYWVDQLDKHFLLLIMGMNYLRRSHEQFEMPTPPDLMEELPGFYSRQHDYFLQVYEDLRNYRGSNLHVVAIPLDGYVVGDFNRWLADLNQPSESQEAGAQKAPSLFDELVANVFPIIFFPRNTPQHRTQNNVHELTLYVGRDELEKIAPGISDLPNLRITHIAVSANHVTPKTNTTIRIARAPYSIFSERSSSQKRFYFLDYSDPLLNEYVVGGYEDRILRIYPTSEVDNLVDMGERLTSPIFSKRFSNCSLEGHYRIIFDGPTDQLERLDNLTLYFLVESFQ